MVRDVKTIMAGNVVTKPGVPAGLLVAGDSDGKVDQSIVSVILPADPVMAVGAQRDNRVLVIDVNSLSLLM